MVDTNKPQESTAAEAALEVTTLLGRGSEFSGKLTFDGAVRIDGRFTGEIVSEGTLVVGPDAEITADIAVTAVLVKGRVKGNITATQGIELHAPGRVDGQLSCPQLYIEKGSIFNGSCEMPGGVDEGASKPAAGHKKTDKAKKGSAEPQDSET